MNIAVVDNYNTDRQRLYQLIQGTIASLEGSINLTPFPNYDAFLERFQPGSYDIVFLDTHLEDVNGVREAERIRNMDTRCKLIFVSSILNPAQEGYEVKASYYMLKPVTEDALRHAFQQSINQELRESRFIEVVSNRQRKQVRLSNIVYISMERNAVVLHTIHGSEKVYSSFGSFSPNLLKDDRFLLCYHGCIINMDYIADVNQNTFILKNGTQLSIRRKGATAIKAKYQSYLTHQAYC